MTDNALDKKLEGRLFNLLEVKARIRLGELVQLRRRSRARNISLLQAAFDASQVSPELARAIAEEAGLEGWGGGRAARDTPGARPRPVRPQGQGEPARPPTRPQPPPGAQPARPAPPGAQPLRPAPPGAQRRPPQGASGAPFGQISPPSGPRRAPAPPPLGQAAPSRPAPPRSGPPPIPASALAPPPSAPTVAQRGRPIRVEGRAPMTGPLAGLEGQETRPPELHPRAPARQSSTIGMKAAPAILRGTDQMAFIDDRVFEDANGERHVTNAFYIDKTPVTNTEYYEYVKKTGMNPPPHWHGPQPPITLLDHPVVGVNFEEAKRFARWRGARLPSSEEWQAAAIGPDNAPFPWGGWLPGYCNSVEMDINTTTPVTAYPQGASQAGCLDLVGNVWEWVEGGGIGLKAEVWGGSFREVCNQKGRISRSQAPKDKRYLFVGFRCAKDAP